MTLRRKYLLFLSLNLIIAGFHQTFSDEDVDSGDGYDDFEDDEYDEEGDMSGYDGDSAEREEHGDDDDDDGEDEEREEDDPYGFGEGEEFYTRPCTKALQEIGTSINDDDKSDDTFIPQCTTGGDFEPRQCHKSMCWCMTRDGIEMKNSKHPEAESRTCLNFTPDLFKKLTTPTHSRSGHFSSSHPAFLAAVVVMVVMGLAGAVLVAMFVVYRMRKKDEGSYALAHNSNSSAPERRSTRSLIFGGATSSGVKDGGHPSDQHFYSLQQQLQQPLQQEFYA